jgi:adenosylcobinamide-phosphate synthase
MPFAYDSWAYPFALALAAALIDVTLGYPAGLARRIGTPTRWLTSWLSVVRLAAEGWSGPAALAIYLAPPLVAGAVVAELLPHGPIGFAATALLASAFCGRQSLDARARAVARAWEEEGPYEAFGAAEALGADEGDPRVVRSGASAIAARFADEVAVPTVFIVIGGLPGVAFARALTIAGRWRRDNREVGGFGDAVATLERWTITPAARLGALWLALAAGPRPAAWRAVAAPASRPTAPAEAALVAALGDPQRDDPAYMRRALALYRRAAAVELAALAVIAVAAALAI